MHQRLPGLVASLLALCTLSFAASAADNLASLGKLASHHASVSAMVVDINNARILATLNPDSRLTPASVTKLFTSAMALKHWGPDHHFVTRLVTNGSVKKGVVSGNLIFAGNGDPDLDTSQLRTLVMRLRQAGITHVTGSLVINAGLFGKISCTTKDRCRAHHHSKHAYDARLGSAGVNFNTLEISIVPAPGPGKPARIALRPPAMPGVAITGTIKTAAPASKAHYRIRRVTKKGNSTLEVSGEVPAGGGPYRVMRSVADPARYTGRVLSTLLAQAGIQIDGRRVITYEPLPQPVHTLAKISSPALAIQLRKMMTYSNNYMADTLTLDTLAGNDPEYIDLSLAAANLENLAQSANRASPYPATTHTKAPRPLVIDSGSGLTITNRVSARDVVNLLTYMYHQNALFSAFLGSLPVPLSAPSTMFKSGNVALLHRTAIKTGYLTEPVSVLGMAGYMRLQNGDWGAFAMLVNGTPKHSHIPFARSRNAMRDDLQRLLARY